MRIFKNSGSEFVDHVVRLAMPVQQPSGQGAELSPETMQSLSQLGEVASKAKAGDTNAANEVKRIVDGLYMDIHAGQVMPTEEPVPEQTPEAMPEPAV